MQLEFFLLLSYHSPLNRQILTLVTGKPVAAFWVEVGSMNKQNNCIPFSKLNWDFSLLHNQIFFCSQHLNNLSSQKGQT